MIKTVFKNCIICGTAFSDVPHKIENRKYCSTACGHIGKRRREERICVICGKEFNARQSQIKKEQGEYCSRKCHGEARRRQQISCTCKTCGKEFTLRRSLIERGDGKYCSKECAHAPTRTGQWRKCKNCGREFYKKQSKIDNGRGIYCSKGCYTDDMSNGRITEYPTEFNDEYKTLIRERDQYTCAVCKQPGKAVHHINYDKSDMRPETKITLCKHCHILTNYNREYWELALTTLMRLRESQEIVEMSFIGVY